MRRLVITLLVLVALFVAVDRITLAAAEREVAARMQVAGDLETRPEVKVRGFPFLSQAVRGHYRRIDVTVPRITRGGVSLRRLAAHLRGVDAPIGQLLRAGAAADVRADTATASATVPYHAVERRMPGDLDIRPAGDRLRLSGRMTVRGLRLPVDALVGVSVRGGDVALVPRRVEVAGQQVGGAVAGRFSFSVPVGRLPFGLDLTGVRAARHGLRISASAHDVHIAAAR